jgi:hypothetical protein
MAHSGRREPIGTDGGLRPEPYRCASDQVAGDEVLPAVRGGELGEVVRRLADVVAVERLFLLHEGDLLLSFVEREVWAAGQRIPVRQREVGAAALGAN